MKTINLNSAADLLEATKHLFTLSEKDNYKKAIDGVLKNSGVQFTLLVAEQWCAFDSTSGKSYKLILKNNQNTVRSIVARVTFPKRDIESDKLNTTKHLLLEEKSIATGHVRIKLEDVAQLDWSDFAVAISNHIDKKIVQYTKCERCVGTGYIAGYMHIKNGICFTCGGVGGTFKPKTATFKN